MQKTEEVGRRSLGDCRLIIFSLMLILMNSVVLATAGSALAELDLGGSDWSLANTNKSWAITSKCKVPGDVYTDLLRNGMIREPFYRYGDVDYRWIAYDNWTYTKSFSIPTAIISQLRGGFPANRVMLVFDGVQVVANVSLNGVFLGLCVDQFLQYRFDVTSIVNAAVVSSESGSVLLNLSVAFTSSVLYGLMMYDVYSLGPKPDAPAYLQGLPYRNMVRGEQSSFGWDWGPAFAPQGIYRPVRLLFDVRDDGLSTARIVHVVPHAFPMPYNQTVDQPLSDGNNSFWMVFDVYISATSDNSTSRNLGVNVRVSGGPSLSNISNSTSAVVPITLSPGNDDATYVSIELYVNNVALWWPNGYGSPTLHRLVVTVNEEATGRLLDSTTISTGIRSVELITHGDPLSYKPAASGGGDLTSTTKSAAREDDGVSDRPVMFFRINGIPIFAQGANLVPFDAFQGRVNDSVMEDILDSAVEANMNMVRVWGGGLFPTDSFYSMADEMGLMVWQEMIFACAEYPVDPPFLDTVRREISYQIRRLSSHPSIVMWSGNNENEVYDFGPGSPYEILDYTNVLYQIIREDTSRPIWPASPSTGFAEGVTASGLPAGTQANPLPFKVGGRSGDTHWYNYFDCPNVDLYPKTNFGSEFGFQSLPWFDNIAPVSEPGDWSLFSAFMNHRQHHPDGNKEIAALLRKNFQVPVDLNSTSESVFKRVIYLSQLQQVLCIADEASFYKRGRNMPYRTMGSLYWQLNQNWQAPSWTSLEYGGEWKILHYAMRDVYDKLYVSSFYNQTDDAVVAHVASNLLDDVLQAYVTVEVVPFAPLKRKMLLETVSLPTIPALSGVFFWTTTKQKVMERIAPLCPDESSCFLYFTLRSRTSAYPLSAPQPLWLTTVKNLQLDVNAQVSIRVLSVALQQATLSVSVPSTSGPAIYVFLQSKKYKGIFSHNVLFLVPSEAPREVEFRCKKAMKYEDGKEEEQQYIASMEDFADSLVVQYLNQMP